MRKDRVAAYDALGRSHWWLTSKYAILHDLLRTQTPEDLALDPALDVGCAGGAFTEGLEAVATRRYGLDKDAAILAAARREGMAGIAGSAAELPCHTSSFRLVTAIDVLEHLPDDAEALREFHRVLRREGYLLLSVPAFPALFGRHDVLFGHLRRYTRKQLSARVTQAGFRIIKATYIQPAFFAPLWVKRRLLPEGDPIVGDFWTPPRPLNRLLHSLVALERFPLRFMNFPLGTTLLLLAQKEDW